MFKNTFATLGYEYEWCYYRGEHLPYGVMISWDEGIGADDKNLQMAREKYPQFTYPKYYYFLPTADEVRDSYKNESSNLQLTDVLDQTFTLLNTLVNSAIATNKKYIQVLWTDINKVNPEYVKAQFYTENNTPKIHSWSSDDTIATYSTRLSNEIIASIYKNSDTVVQFSIQELLTVSNNGHGYNYHLIYDTQNQPLGFILSWHEADDTETQKTIESILMSYGTTSEGTEEILILPVFNQQDQIVNRQDIRVEMRSSYIKTIADKIQSKLNAAFNKSESSVALLWTEISSSNAASVRKEWNTSDYFSKKLTTNKYDEEATIITLNAVNSQYSIAGALHSLNVCSNVSADGINTTDNYILWDYIHYQSETNKNADNSCGLALAFGTSNNAISDIQKVKEQYAAMKDPAKKENNK